MTATGPRISRYNVKHHFFQKPTFFSLLIIAGLLFAVFTGPCSRARRSAPPVPAPADETRETVIRDVIDGDSVRDIEGREIRILGVNTPEWGEPFSRQARDYLERLLLNKSVTMVYGNERKDKYGRHLAHILVEEGEKKLLAGEELVRRGLANVYIIEPNVLFKERLTAAQRKAVDRKCGIWSLEVEPEPHYVVTTHRFHRPTCPHVKDWKHPKTMKNRDEILKLGKSPCRTCKP